MDFKHWQKHDRLAEQILSWIDVCSLETSLFGNEYHTICEGDLLQGVPIMLCVELVEGKDQLPQLRPMEFDNCEKTVGLMLQMSRN